MEDNRCIMANVEQTEKEILKERAIAKLVQVVGMTESEIRAMGCAE